MSIVGERYARAVVDAVGIHERSVLKNVLQGLETFWSVYCESELMRELLRYPPTGVERNEVLQKAVEPLALPTEAERLLLVMAKNERLDSLDEVLKEVQGRIDASEGRIRAKITSALVLSNEQKIRIKLALERRYGCEVLLELNEDKSLLGAFCCEVNGARIDCSLSSKIGRLADNLMQSVFA